MRDDDAQVMRLVAVYEGLGDRQLLQMAEDADDLTEAARTALAQVMRGRGLAAAARDEAVEADAELEVHSSQISEDERWLWTFQDAFQASEAIRLLDGAGIGHRVMEKVSDADPEDANRTLIGLMIIVEAKDYAAAVQLLRAGMGLFPLAEVEGADQSPLTPMDGTVMLAMFDREEALLAAEALGRAGISYWWRDGRQETDELPDEGTVAIEVRGADAHAAQRVVEKRLAEI